MKRSWLRLTTFVNPKTLPAAHVLTLPSRLQTPDAMRRSAVLRAVANSAQAHADDLESEAAQTFDVPGYAAFAWSTAAQVLEILAHAEAGLAFGRESYGPPVRALESVPTPVLEPRSTQTRPTLDALVREQDAAARADLVLQLQAELNEMYTYVSRHLAMVILSRVAYGYYRLGAVPAPRARELVMNGERRSKLRVD